MYLCYFFPQSIVARQDHRWIRLHNLGGVCLLMDSFRNLLLFIVPIDRWFAPCIAVDSSYQYTPRTIGRGWQSLSIDTSHDLLCLAMAVDGHASHTVGAENGHRWTCFTICKRLAMAVGGHASQSIGAGNGHRWTRFTIYGRLQWSSMDMFHNLFR